MDSKSHLFFNYCLKNLKINLLLIVTLTFFSLILLISFFPKSYSSSILMAPAEQEGDANVESSGLSGLASLAGIEVGGGKQALRATINLEYLKSRTFLNLFFIENGYIKKLAPNLWDAENNILANKMSLTELHGYIYKYHLSFAEDRRKKTITLSVKSNDPDLSSELANAFINLGNEVIRKKTIDENNAFFETLSESYQTIESITLKQGISSKILTKLFNNAVASSKEDFAFNIIDPAMPNPRQIPSKFILAIFSGGISLIIILLFRIYTFRKLNLE